MERWCHGWQCNSGSVAANDAARNKPRWGRIKWSGESSHTDRDKEHLVSDAKPTDYSGFQLVLLTLGLGGTTLRSLPTLKLTTRPPKIMNHEYTEYLKSDHWKNLRAAAVSCWGDRCMNCSVPKVDVHHLRYGNLYDVSTADLMPLCRRCHGAVHESRRLKTLLLSNENSEKKRSLILGFLAGRDEMITVKVKWQSAAQIEEERRMIQRNEPLVLITKYNYKAVSCKTEPWNWMKDTGINPRKKGWAKRCIGHQIPQRWMKY